jgi:protein SCO1/2
METGLPAANGWMLLVLAPLSFLVGIFLLWGSDLQASLLSVARTRPGACVATLLALVIVTEGTWVVRKVYAARAVSAWTPGSRDDAELPEAYPRQAVAAPDFALVDQHGQTVSLRALAGQPVVITFVFAHCETMCPLVVDTLKRAAPGTTLLVTLDPWRDTPNALPGIVRHWELPPNFHVLSSKNAADVLRVAEAYGVSFERNPTSGDIVHPGLVFLVDGRGQLVYTFNDPPPAWVREGLERLDKHRADLG